MAQLFISYSRVDKPFTKSLADRLKSVYSVWFDDDLRGGQVWWEEILHQIELGDIFVYLMSQESVGSPYCLAELDEAERLQKPILPVLIRARTVIPVYLQQYQYVDMSGGITVDSIWDLRNALDHLMRQIPEEAPPPRTLTRPPVPSVPDKPPRRFPWTIVAGGLAAVLAVAVIAFLLLGGGEDDPGTGPPSATTEVAQPASGTPTITLSPTITETPDVVAAAAQVLTQQAAQVIIDGETATAARITQEFALGQTEIANLTATATHWTDTPTPNLTASVNAVLTGWANETATEVSVNMTATATRWTDTPTATITPMPTLTEREQAVQLAVAGVNSNDDWTPYLEEIDGMEFALVPAGCFMMGSEDGESDEQPIHEQCFEEPFWIGIFEVTNGQFGSVGCAEASSQPDQPRNCMTWFAAYIFCERNGGYVPSEREWEYTARGPDNLTYPWGDEFIPENVVYGGNSGEMAENVGSRPNGTSWVGAMDMSGNLLEWTSSRIQDYPYSAIIGESAGDIESYRIRRGGSFYSRVEFQRSADRSSINPAWQSRIQGFRCARDFDG